MMILNDPESFKDHDHTADLKGKHEKWIIVIRDNQGPDCNLFLRSERVNCRVRIRVKVIYQLWG